MRVRDAMTREVVEVAADATCRHAAALMRDHQTGTLVVAAEGHMFEGIVTDRDLVVRCMALGVDPGTQRVGDYFDRHATTVEPETELERAIDSMRNARVRRLPVVEDGVRVVGLLSLDDVAPDVRHYVDAFLAVAGQYHKR